MIISFVQSEVGRSILLFFAGLIAGFINVLAGGGSLLTLPVLILAGLNPIVANGTNRIGILLENLTATRHFQQRQPINLQQGGMLALWTIPGAVTGAILSINISNLWFQRLLVIVLLIGAATLLFPKRTHFLSGKRRDGQASPWLYPALLGLGFYGGFIQAGIGFLFILVLSNLLVQNLSTVTAYKTLIIGIYTLPTLFIFAWTGVVRWEPGMIIAVGGILGARFAARITLGRRGEIWIKVAVVIMVVVLATKLWA